MEFLESDHNNFLVIMPCLVALIAGFTGLSLTRSLSDKTVAQKTLSIALASVALGGGIWSMHFVAMLGLQLPVLFYYDAAITLISALTAILIVGAALILLHFTKRTPVVFSAAGALVGIGILVMHYIGMAGLELCRAIYTLLGILTSSTIAILLCIIAFWMTYYHRTNKNIFLGTICFGVAVCSVHFFAMASTNFLAAPQSAEFGPRMSNEVLALGVILSSFLIFGTFLWVGITYLVPSATEGMPQPSEAEARFEQPQALSITGLKIPCERDGGKVFVSPSEVMLLRADGRYTQIYTRDDRLFCVWPITEATKKLLPEGFLQTHRSYLINPSNVARFERDKDKGRCIFDIGDVPSVPVSRSKLKEIQDALLVSRGAVRAD